jgi:hypothetical protein
MAATCTSQRRESSEAFLKGPFLLEEPLLALAEGHHPAAQGPCCRYSRCASVPYSSPSPA